MNAGTSFHLLFGDPPNKFVSQLCLGRDDPCMSEHWIAGLELFVPITHSWPNFLSMFSSSACSFSLRCLGFCRPSGTPLLPRSHLKWGKPTQPAADWCWMLCRGGLDMAGVDSSEGVQRTGSCFSKYVAWVLSRPGLMITDGLMLCNRLNARSSPCFTGHQSSKGSHQTGHECGILSSDDR